MCAPVLPRDGEFGEQMETEEFRPDGGTVSVDVSPGWLVVEGGIQGCSRKAIGEISRVVIELFLRE